MKTTTLAAYAFIILWATGCDSKKLGIAGATCSASSDCSGELQCVLSTCVDPNAVRDAAAEAQQQKDAEQKDAMDALSAEIEKLIAEQTRLEGEKVDLDAKLSKVTDAVEKQQLLAKQAELDAQIKENANKQAAKRGGQRAPK